MEMKKLHSKARTLWLIRGVLLSIIIVGVYFAIIFSVPKDYFKPTAISIGIFFGLIVICSLIYPFLKYNCYSYGYDSKRIVIKFGVIFKHNVVVPVRQIQDLHVYEGPIMLLMKLSGVILSTAGSNFMIANLNKEVAKKMVEDLEESLNKLLEETNEEAL